MDIGERLRSARKNKKMSRVELGEYIGRSEHSIKKYEIGQVVPSVEILEQLAEVLDLNLGDILKSSLVPENIATKSRYYFLEQYLNRLGYFVHPTKEGYLHLRTPDGYALIDGELLEELYNGIDSYSVFKISEIIDKARKKGMDVFVED